MYYYIVNIRKKTKQPNFRHFHPQSGSDFPLEQRLFIEASLMSLMFFKIHEKVMLKGNKGVRDQMVITVLIASFLVLSGPQRILAQAKRIEVNFSHRTLSARIREAPLREVIEAIEKKGIWFKLWFKGKESVLNEKVSVRFKSLPLKKGMERILSTLNHCLVFDHNGVLSGVILLGKPESRTTRSTRRIRTPRRTPRRYNPRR